MPVLCWTLLILGRQNVETMIVQCKDSAGRVRGQFWDSTGTVPAQCYDSVRLFRGFSETVPGQGGDSACTQLRPCGNCAGIFRRQCRTVWGQRGKRTRIVRVLSQDVPGENRDSAVKVWGSDSTVLGLCWHNPGTVQEKCEDRKKTE